MGETYGSTNQQRLRAGQGPEHSGGLNRPTDHSRGADSRLGDGQKALKEGKHKQVGVVSRGGRHRKLERSKTGRGRSK